MTTDTETERRDPAGYNEASFEFDPASLDSTEDTVAELLKKGGPAAVAAWVDEQEANVPGRREMITLFMKFTCMVMGCEGDALKRWALYFALGLVKHLTMEQVADHYGFSDAMLSRRANEWIDRLNLDRPDGMKSDPARKSYRRAQLKLSAHKN
jgi:hypothetical protein